MMTDITRVRRYSDLPSEARKYLKRIETLLGTRISIISVGSHRDQTIQLS